MTAGRRGPYDGPAVLDESFREVAEARLRKFWADAVTKAGGTDELSDRLAKMGIVGRDGPYHPKTIEAWRGGRRQASADVAFAVAADLEISLDNYVFGRALEQPDEVLAKKVADLEATQDLLMGWMLRNPEFAELVRRRDEQQREELGA